MDVIRLAASRLFVIALILAAGPAPAETVNCIPITILPAIINVQGVYCFKGNLTTGMTSGNAIDIRTNNVVLDLNGFKLGGLSAGLGTNTFGIYAIDRQNITIRNGTIRGFRQAIVLLTSGASQGHLVEDVRADQNTEVGIQVAGSGNIIRNNQVVSTGGTTIFGADANAYGIYVAGNGPRVVNNDVIDTAGTGLGQGTAILFTDTVIGGLAVNNRVSSATNGIVFLGTGKYRDNLTFAVAGFIFSGGTDAGNNF